MGEYFSDFFNTSDFPARWHCGNWSEFLGWLHILSDVATFAAYFAIPAVLFYFARKRRDFPFPRLFWLFGAFILSCGTVHLIEAIIFWNPIYRVSGAMKFITAVVSWATVISLARYAPRIMALPSLAATNERLKNEIQQRRESQASLQRLTARYETLLNGTASIIWTTSEAGEFAERQDSWERYTGQDFATHRGFGFLKAMHEHDRDDSTQRWQTARDSNSKYQATYRLWHQPTGSYRLTTAEALPVTDDDGNVIEWIGTNTDIEDQAVAESARDEAQSELIAQRNQLELIYEWAPVGMSLIDRDFRFVRINERLAEINGHPKQDHIGRRADELLPDLDVQIRPLYERVMQSGQPVLDVEIVGTTAASDGQRTWLASYFPLKQNTGDNGQFNVMAVNAIVQDITERKQQENRLRESEQAALAANQSKSEFLANMSHEIRTPMAAILGYADVLLGHLKDPDNRNCVSVIKRNGNFLLELINDILDLSRIEAGKMDVEIKTCDLVQLVSDIDSLMFVRAGEKELELSATFTTLVPSKIQTDAIRLRQVLINLIGNAIKFTEKGEVKLQVRYESRVGQGGATPTQHGTTSEDGSNGGSALLYPPCNQQGIGKLHFEVIDTGIGMTPQQQDRLFKPFSQGDSSVTRQYGGSGLGLAISRRLIEMLGGEISIESEAGSGSTFRVKLPIETPEDATMVQPVIEQHPSTEEKANAVPRTLGCRVLVVDDRRDVRHISQHFLEKAGATVATAEDGQQGIDAALAARDDGQPFDLILMDIQMPNVDGMQATAELRTAGIETPIVALTADAMKGDREKCLDDGCDDYLSKPIDHLLLVNMVARYTEDLTVEDLRRRRAEHVRSLRPPSP